MGMVMITKNMHTDVSDLGRRIRAGAWTPITNSPCFPFPVSESLTINASIHLIKHQNTGQVLGVESYWGGHLFGHTSGAS